MAKKNTVPVPVRSREGCKVGWSTYATEAEALTASELFKVEARRAEAQLPGAWLNHADGRWLVGSGAAMRWAVEVPAGRTMFGGISFPTAKEHSVHDTRAEAEAVANQLLDRPSNLVPAGPKRTVKFATVREVRS